MPDEHIAPMIPTLMEVGTRVINLAYLIMAERGEEPGGGRVLDVHLESGLRFRLRDDEADAFLVRLRALLPDAPSTGATTPTKVVRGPGRKSDPGPSVR